LDPEDRKNKVSVPHLASRYTWPTCCHISLVMIVQKKLQTLLKEGWLELPEDEKDTFRGWTEWDKKRYARDLAIFESRRIENEDVPVDADEDDMKAVHVPKKRKSPAGNDSAVPKKKKS
jgi:hypothetical protein